jgi:hypothetical protein
MKLRLCKKTYKVKFVHTLNPAETNLRHTKKIIKAPKR